MANTPQRACASSLSSIVRSISLASAKSGGAFETLGAGFLLVARGVGVARSSREMAGERRSTSKTDVSTRPNEAMASKPVFLNLISKAEGRRGHLALNSLAGKQCLCASCRQQFARSAVNFFDRNFWNGDAVNHPFGLAQRNITFRRATIKQQHYWSANCHGDVHATAVVGNENPQTRLRRCHLPNPDPIQNHGPRRQEP